MADQITPPAPVAGTPAPVATPPAPAVDAAAKIAPPAAPVAAPAAPAAVPAAPKADAPKRLITEPVATDAVKEPVKVEAKADAPADTAWKLEAPKDGPIAAPEVAAIESFAKANGLTQKQAQAFLTHRTEATNAEVSRINDVWFDESSKDPEIGGPKLQQTVANAQKVLTAYATPAERKAIAESPFANNPLFLRILNRVAGGMPTEDVNHVGTQQGAVKQMPKNHGEAAQLLYGKR